MISNVIFLQCFYFYWFKNSLWDSNRESFRRTLKPVCYLPGCEMNLFAWFCFERCHSLTILGQVLFHECKALSYSVVVDFINLRCNITFQCYKFLCKSIQSPVPPAVPCESDGKTPVSEERASMDLEPTLCG